MSKHNCRIGRVFVAKLVCGREIHQQTSSGLTVFRLEGVDLARADRPYAYAADREA